jgi:hypothetical protein
MSDRASGRKVGVILSWSVSVVLLLALAVIWVKFDKVTIQLEDVVGNIAKKSRILSQMKEDLLLSVGAEKSAVLSESDEESKAFANQSRQAIAAVEKERKELGILIESSNNNDELKSLREFDQCWAEFLKTDQTILDLAVQNTNLKAVRLSLTEANDAAQRFVRDLSALIETGFPSGNCEEMVVPVLQAITACLHIHYLQMPHIRAAGDSEMDRIEADMRVDNAVVESSLSKLAGLAGEKEQPLLRNARRAYNDFIEVTITIVDLSRQNTNIKSMELSLGKKLAITAECEGILSALRELAQSRTFKATR